MSAPVARLRPTTAVVGGVAKTVYILCTDSPDSFGGGGMMPCGEFDPNRAYTLFNMVTVSAGSNSGTWYYISATPSTGSAGANPTLNPWAGGGQWFQIAGASAAADYMTMI